MAVREDRSVRFRAGLLVVALLLLVGVGVGSPTSAAAKGGAKIHACVVKHGHDKGVMRFVPRGKCHRGERKLTWNRKGKHGPVGQTGEPGPQGPSGITDDLLNTITLQQAKIDALTQQLGIVTQQLSAATQQLNGLAPQVAALCTQMTAVTGHSDALRTAISGLSLNGVLTALGGVLNIPALPGALGPFSCP